MATVIASQVPSFIHHFFLLCVLVLSHYLLKWITHPSTIQLHIFAIKAEGNCNYKYTKLLHANLSPSDVYVPLTNCPSFTHQCKFSSDASKSLSFSKFIISKFSSVFIVISRASLCNTYLTLFLVSFPSLNLEITASCMDTQFCLKVQNE